MDERRRAFLRTALAGTIGRRRVSDRPSGRRPIWPSQHSSRDGAALSAGARQPSGEADLPFLRGGRDPPYPFSSNVVRDNSSALHMDRK